MDNEKHLAGWTYDLFVWSKNNWGFIAGTAVAIGYSIRWTWHKVMSSEYVSKAEMDEYYTENLRQHTAISTDVKELSEKIDNNHKALIDIIINNMRGRNG